MKPRSRIERNAPQGLCSVNLQVDIRSARRRSSAAADERYTLFARSDFVYVIYRSQG
jgi:hypothetical protein